MKIINKIIMTLAGLLLIVAAGLKFHEMVATCVPSWQDNPMGFWESYEFFLIQIPLEFALGVWLVSGLFRKAASIAGTLAYFGFIFVTIFKIVTGAESCGCFGQITVNPRITLFVMDIPIFLLLAFFRPKDCKLFPPPWPDVFHMLAVAVPVLAVMALAAPAMITFQPDCIKQGDVEADPCASYKLQVHRLTQQLAEWKLKKLQQAVAPSLDKEFVSGALRLTVSDKPEMYTVRLGEQVLVVNASDLDKILITAGASDRQKVTLTETGQVEINLIQKAVPEVETKDPVPETQAVNQWDWMEFVVEDDVRQQISEGLVVVMMHRYDCPTCEEMAPAYSEYYREMADQGIDQFKIAFLSIPPYGEEDHVPDDTTCIVGNLTDEKKWGLMSPLVVALLDGELQKTWEPGTAPEPDEILNEIFGP